MQVREVKGIIKFVSRRFTEYISHLLASFLQESLSHLIRCLLNEPCPCHLLVSDCSSPFCTTNCVDIKLHGLIHYAIPQVWISFFSNATESPSFPAFDSRDCFGTNRLSDGPQSWYMYLLWDTARQLNIHQTLFSTIAGPIYIAEQNVPKSWK